MDTISREITFLKHYEDTPIQKNLPPKTEKNQIKNSDIFHISAQNIDCRYSLTPVLLCKSMV